VREPTPREERWKDRAVADKVSNNLISTVDLSGGSNLTRVRDIYLPIIG